MFETANRMIPIRYYTRVLAVVGAITARIGAYTILLLGQPWLRRVKAAVNDEQGEYTIRIANKMKHIGRDGTLS